MLKTFSAAAAVVLVRASALTAPAQTSAPMGTMAPMPMAGGAHGHGPNMNCTSAPSTSDMAPKSTGSVHSHYERNG